MTIETSPHQTNAMSITERVTSIFSLLGILFILATFLLGRGFDKPINRLIFLASWSNLGTNVAALIAEDGPAAGQNSSLCQFQAFAIQMFLGVDALWALCMSFNVYLALFCGWTAQRMRAQEWKYFLGCYGCSFIPALVYLFVKTNSKGKVYGPAVLWCWVDTSWDFLRVATLYGIVWVALAFALIIYCLAGRKVWRNRHELQGLFNPFNENPFEHAVVTHTVDVTTYARPSSVTPSLPVSGEDTVIPGTEAPTSFDPYSVDVEAGQPDSQRKPSAPEMFKVRSLTRNAALSETNPDAWLYARVAFLFFCALLLSWVPSSVNRLYSLSHPDKFNFGLNYTESFVLPLQGFFNSMVYIMTSQTACLDLWRSLTGAQELPRKNHAGVSGLGMGKSDTMMHRFTSRRTSQRLQSSQTSVATLKGLRK